MGTKTLVADDSGTMRKIIIRSLNALGIADVIEAADGDEACELFAQHQFDLVLTDWNMPGKSGLEVVQHIRAAGSTIPVMLITTEGEKSRVLKAIQAGVSDYVVKPFDAKTLREKIEKHLGLVGNQSGA